MIAFLPYADARAVELLEHAYVQRFELACTVSWIGVLGGGIWGESEVSEDDMVGLRLHGIRRL